MMHGLYPFQDPQFTYDFQYNYDGSVLQDTAYDGILNDITLDSEKCFRGPVIRLEDRYDVMMHTRNCKRVHAYLNKN